MQATHTRYPAHSARLSLARQFTRLSIIIPAFNEEGTIGFTLEKIADVVLLQNIEKEIIIINDASTDETEAIVQEFMEYYTGLHIKYLAQPVNMGKGAAIHRGLKEATGQYVLIQDADMEYDPAEYNNLLRPILNGHADVVYGSRFLGGNAHRILFFWHSIGNRFLTTCSNMFNNLNLTDMCTGYKVFRRDIIDAIPLKETRFGFCTEVTSKMARLPGIRIFEVGISYYGRTYKDGKKIKWKDGFRVVYCIFKYAFYRKEKVTTPPIAQPIA